MTSNDHQKTSKSTAIRFNSKTQPPHKRSNEVAEKLTDMRNITPSKTNSITKQSRITKLLANPDVRLWFDNLS